MEFVYLLVGVDAYTNDILGVFASEQLAEEAKELDEGSYAFYSIRTMEVTHE